MYKFIPLNKVFKDPKKAIAFFRAEKKKFSWDNFKIQ